MKRLFDIVCSALGLIVGAPVLIGIAVAVWLVLGRPVLFRQLRTGRDGRSFWLVKFRTMREARDSSGRLLSDSERMTRFGSFLRSTSLDELPELWSVFRGEMSLVGPRPLLPEYVPLYTSEQRQRLRVRPGMTGWAQVNGRNAVTWERKFELDVWYVRHQSFALDLWILLLTAKKVVIRDGITQAGQATSEPFRGSPG